MCNVYYFGRQGKRLTMQFRNNEEISLHHHSTFLIVFSNNFTGSPE